MSKFCKYCGAALNDSARFCKGCGNATRLQSAPQPTAQPQYRQPAQPQYQQSPQPQPTYAPPAAPVYQEQNMPQKKSGGMKPLIAVIAGLAAVALIATGIIVIPKMIGGGDGSDTVGSISVIERGKSVSAND